MNCTRCGGLARPNNEVQVWRQLSPKADPFGPGDLDDVAQFDFNLCDRCALQFQDEFCAHARKVVAIIPERGAEHCAHCGELVAIDGVGWGGTIAEAPSDLDGVGETACDTLCMRCVDAARVWLQPSGARR
jgi:hypothetical protein